MYVCEVRNPDFRIEDNQFPGFISSLILYDVYDVIKGIILLLTFEYKILIRMISARGWFFLQGRTSLPILILRPFEKCRPYGDYKSAPRFYSLLRWIMDVIKWRSQWSTGGGRVFRWNTRISVVICCRQTIGCNPVQRNQNSRLWCTLIVPTPTDSETRAP